MVQGRCAGKPTAPVKSFEAKLACLSEYQRKCIDKLIDQLADGEPA
jgi:hypothetical protein